MTDIPMEGGPLPRRRGAPEGNTNALKHGFYSRRFRNGELEDLVRLPEGELKEEIAMLRVINRRVVDMAEDGASPDGILEFYHFISITCMRLSTLLRTQKDLLKGGSGADVLMQALDKVLEEFHERLQKAAGQAG